MSNSSKRLSFTHDEKVRIIQRFESRGAGVTQRMFASDNGIPISTLSSILRDRNLPTNQVLNYSKAKKKRNASLVDIDQALLIWFKERRAQNVVINGPILKQKANEFANSLGHSGWACSNGWLCRWKLRHNLLNKTVVGQANTVNLSEVNEWIHTTGASIQSRYDNQNIYNADETGLFWRLLPTRTYCERGESCRDGQKSKDRVTVLFNIIIINIVHPPDVVTVSDDEVDDQGEPDETVTYLKAIEGLQTIETYLCQRGKEDETGLCHKLQKLLLEAKTDSSQQTVITEYFIQPDTNQ